jgi:hypothetical protein
MANFTSSELKEKIMARESFWVASSNERVIASRIASTLGIKYTTGADDRGGFYICKLPTVKKPTK